MTEASDNNGKHTEDHLTAEQTSRVAALHEARQVLTTRAGAFGGEHHIEVTDLYSLADYILTGEDPWPDSHELLGQPIPGVLRDTLTVVPDHPDEHTPPWTPEGNDRGTLGDDIFVPAEAVHGDLDEGIVSDTGFMNVGHTSDAGFQAEPPLHDADGNGYVPPVSGMTTDARKRMRDTLSAAGGAGRDDLQHFTPGQVAAKVRGVVDSIDIAVDRLFEDEGYKMGAGTVRSRVAKVIREAKA